MATKTDEEWREIIINRLSYWMRIISGKEITKKKSRELEDITNQVMGGRTPNKKKIINNN